MLKQFIATVVFGVAVSAAALLTGCNKTEPPTEKAGEEMKPAPGKGEDDHAHKPGAHGGTIVALGRDSYHVEVVFEKGGVVRLFMLGKDEAKLQDVEVQDLVGHVVPAGGSEAVQMKFSAEPQKGDAVGKTTLFVGKLPAELQGKKVQVTINNLQIGGERFRLGFSNETAGHKDAAMPKKLGSAKEQPVFFTPGGVYTAADIKANGDTVPSVKYRDIDVEHDDDPKPGDKICPISKTKANPQLTWVVGGKTYEFCCTPCVQEFVAKAKEKPEEILDPSAYVKK